MYICRRSARYHTGRDNSQTHQLRRPCSSDLRLGLRVSRRGSRILPTIHISLVQVTQTEEMVLYLSVVLEILLLLLLLFVSQVRMRVETLVLHS
jgi:hypothetical protein